MKTRNFWLVSSVGADFSVAISLSAVFMQGSMSE